jgi:hypothetical protein
MSYNPNFRPQYSRDNFVGNNYNNRQAYKPQHNPSLIEMVEQIYNDMDEIKRTLHQIQSQLHNQSSGPLLQLPNINAMANQQYSNNQRPPVNNNNDMLYPTNNNTQASNQNFQQ